MNMLSFNQMLLKRVDKGFNLPIALNYVPITMTS